MLKEIRKEMKKYSSKSRAESNQRFFKTDKGEYGEGDVFLGLTVPENRSIAEKYSDVSIKILQTLLNSKIHEERLLALYIMDSQYAKTRNKKIIDLFLKNTKKINNWDLVDSCAHQILGKYLLDTKRTVLYKLAKSKNLWEKRIAIISTFQFIKNNKFEDTLKISEILLKDEHDLIHKAVGWMLREIGKRNQLVEEKFLKQHYKKMPRTMLRYAIEKFNEEKRQKYLKGEI